MTWMKCLEPKPTWYFGSMLLFLLIMAVKRFSKRFSNKFRKADWVVSNYLNFWFMDFGIATTIEGF